MARATSSGSLLSWPARIQTDSTKFKQNSFQATSIPVSHLKSTCASQCIGRRHRILRLSSASAVVPVGRNNLWASCRPGCLRLRGRRRAVQADAKMFVPGFGEKSPEAKAADSLHNFFTFTALKIVLSQLQSYNPDAYKDLMEFAQKSPLKDGDEFVHQLMRVSPQHKTLAMRILEVRSAYASEDFEWDNVQKLSKKRMEESNTKVLREFLQQSSGMS